MNAIFVHDLHSVLSMNSSVVKLLSCVMGVLLCMVGPLITRRLKISEFPVYPKEAGHIEHGCVGAAGEGCCRTGNSLAEASPKAVIPNLGVEHRTIV